MVFGDMFLTLDDPPVMDSIFAPSQNACVEALTRSVVVLGDEVFDS